MSEMDATLVDIARQYEDEPHYLLQMLRQIQSVYSYVPEAAVLFLAHRLKIPISQVRGCVEFYSFLHSAPRGRYDIYFSNCVADTMRDSRELACRLANRLGIAIGHTRSDECVTVDFTSCTGLCDQGPAALINGRPLTLLNHQRIDHMAELIEKNIPIESWPGEWFIVRDNIRQMGSLFQTLVAPGNVLRIALRSGRQAVLQELDTANLRGRGGAGYKTSTKWQLCYETKDPERYIVCNADEGEPGTFKDRVLLNRLPELLFEGMALAGFVVGSRRGLIYLRGEYAYLKPHLEAILKRMRRTGLLGKNILDRGFDFDIQILLGAGAYICGEESALIESLEGKRGQARVRPPFPVVRGFEQKPTIVNNVQTFIQAAQIVVRGGRWFREQGTEQSRGTVLLCVAGDVDKPGIYEYPYGVNIATVLRNCGAHNVQAVQVGGPSGHTIVPEEFRRNIGFEDLSTTGSLMVFNRSRDMVEVAQNFIRFFQHESCGFCTPCRVGTTILRQLVDKIASGKATAADLDELALTSDVVRQTSHCGLGQTAPNVLIDTLHRFRSVYKAKLVNVEANPGFDLDAELADARKLSGREDLAAHGLGTGRGTDHGR